MKKLLLGSGYVGLRFLKEANRAKELWIASTTSKEKLSPLSLLANQAILLKGEEQDKVKEILSRVDTTIVCAAPKQKSLYHECYVQTALSIAHALKDRSTPFYLLYTSSTSVYGEIHEKELVEAEEIYLSCQSDLVKVCILRLGGIYGPGRDLIKRARLLSGKMLPGSPLEPTNHIHIDDIVAAFLFCVEKQLDGIFDLVNNDHPTKEALYTSLCKELSIPPPTWDPMTFPSKKALSSDKLVQKGFVFQHPFLKE